MIKYDYSMQFGQAYLGNICICWMCYFRIVEVDILFSFSNIRLVKPGKIHWWVNSHNTWKWLNEWDVYCLNMLSFNVSIPGLCSLKTPAYWHGNGILNILNWRSDDHFSFIMGIPIPTRWCLSWYPDNKVHGANMWPTWVLSAPAGSLVGPMNIAFRAEVLIDAATFLWLLINTSQTRSSMVPQGKCNIICIKKHKGLNRAHDIGDEC